MRGLVMNQMQRAMRKRDRDRDIIPYPSKENTIILVLIARVQGAWCAQYKCYFLLKYCYS